MMYGGELRVLSFCDVDRAPQFAKTRKYQVYGVGAEYTPHERIQRSPYVERIKLYAPAHGSENMGKYTDY